MFRMIVAEARSLIRQRDVIEAMADRLLADHPDYRLLRKVPGIGPIIALTILAEAGDLRRFSHHRQFVKFCGLDLATHQSGQYRGQTRLSKYGNARLRRALWMAAQVAIRQRENSFRDKFERYIARDRHNADLRRKALSRDHRQDGARGARRHQDRCRLPPLRRSGGWAKWRNPSPAGP
jgi:transposase